MTDDDIKTDDDIEFAWSSATRWTLSHLVKVVDLPPSWNGSVYSVTGCGRHVNYDRTKPERPGSERCPKCAAVASGEPS